MTKIHKDIIPSMSTEPTVKSVDKQDMIGIKRK